MSTGEVTKEELWKSQAEKLYKSLSWPERCMLCRLVNDWSEADTRAIIEWHAKGRKGNPPYPMGEAIGSPERSSY
jgi:hypothetical protein